MEAVFAQESYEQIIDELKPLLLLHWRELAMHADIPLEPDFEFYRRAADVGRLVIFSARLDGALIGYSIFAIQPSHPHYKTIVYALNDIVWVHHAHRRGGVGKGLRDFWDRRLTEMGVTIAIVDTKVSHPELMYLLKDGGYQTRTCGMEKRLR